MAGGELLGFLGAAVMVGGLVIECVAWGGTKWFSLARCLPWQAVGFILFYVGLVIRIAATTL